jgi:predicted MFS family arabinose efflux permease
MGETGSAMGRAPGQYRGGLRLLQLAAFFSSFDRFVVAPMLVTIAAALGASLAEAGSYDLLFALAALVAIPLGLFAGLARRRYSRHRQ